MSYGPSFLGGYRALITGGAQGIGLEIARALVAVGCRVAVVDRQVGKAAEVASVLGEGSYCIAADITEPDECQAAVATVLEAFGGLDILVNNAAPGRDRSMIGRISSADWDLHHSIVLLGAAAMAENTLDYLSKSNRGVIINISSVLASSVGADQASVAYHASKAGLEQFTRWLAVRCGPMGVRVNAISPGLVDRDFGPKLSDNKVHRKIIETIVPLGRASSGQDIANLVIFLASDAASYITGQVVRVDGGLELNELFGAGLRIYNSMVDIEKS